MSSLPFDLHGMKSMPMAVREFSPLEKLRMALATDNSR